VGGGLRADRKLADGVGVSIGTDGETGHECMLGRTYLTSVSGGCLELLRLLCWPRAEEGCCFRAPPTPLSRWRGPRVCTVWNGEVLGMCALWVCVRPGLLLVRVGRSVFGVGWKSVSNATCDRDLRSPRQWKSIGKNFGPSGFTLVDVVQFERADYSIYDVPTSMWSCQPAYVPQIFRQFL